MTLSRVHTYAKLAEVLNPAKLFGKRRENHLVSWGVARSHLTVTITIP